MKLRDDERGGGGRPQVYVTIVATPRAFARFKDMIEANNRNLEYDELLSKRNAVEETIRDLEDRRRNKCTFGDVAEFVGMEKQICDGRVAVISRLLKQNVVATVGVYALDMFVLPIPTIVKIVSVTSLVIGVLALTLNQINRRMLEDERTAVEIGIKRMNSEIARLHAVFHGILKRMHEILAEDRQRDN